MKIESAQPFRSAKGENARCALTFTLALLFVGALASNFPSPAAAQQGWAPTVATSPGRTFDTPDPFQTGAVQVPPAIDPNMFPAPRNAPQMRPQPQPQKVWSPIVTGAIPDPRDRDRAPVTGATRPRTIPGQPAGAGEVRQTPLKVLAAGDQAAAPAAPAAKVAPTAPTSAGAEGAATPATETIFKKPGPLDAPPPNANGAQQYCFNTVDTAADARFAWQAKKIRDMEAELDKRARQLEAKTEEYKSWLARRDEFARKAHEKLVGFYSRMRPDAAAAQLATVDEEMAAAVVTKLETKVASQIMGEMEPERAAKIATIISGAAKIPPSRKPPAAAPPENKPPDLSGAGVPAGAPRS
ncbi:MotE family protein [Hyphomicrobium sp.]|uniref:MotE family protein n=1 Tax=Hyphomicrobium sp. TaxID=82 RepID=UPI002E332CC9|nr:MotE family protein [Hyphomicrobium sp.]HEX2841780.1 MotE family protein [Hyphomicrobium sp.]